MAMNIQRKLLHFRLSLPFFTWGIVLQSAAPVDQPKARESLIEIVVTRGQGAIFSAGMRTPAPLAVEVRDETGAPVSGAIVSFHLPPRGPTGVFLNGLTTEIVTTGTEGVAVAPTIVWKTAQGPLEIEVTAVKEKLRAGIVIPVEIANSSSSQPASNDNQEFYKPPRRWGKWAAIIAGAGAGVFATKYALAKRAAITSQGTVTETIRIGTPAVTIGGPQ